MNNDEDCDDYDATVNPDATEVVDDGVDQDCDGADLVSPPLPDPPPEEGCAEAWAGAPLVLPAVGLLAARRRRRYT